MGYEIIYDKQFIKNGDKIIPMVLVGSNNCTMFHRGREILEREWCIYNSEICNKTKEEILAWVDKRIPCTDSEMFKEHSKWVVGKDMHKWFERAINNAYTLEEILAVNSHIKVECYVWASHKTEYKHETPMPREYFTDIQSLLAWYEKAQRYIADNKDGEYNNYIHCGFLSIEPLNKPTKIKDNAFDKFIIKVGKNYITDYTENSFSQSPDRLDAKIYNGKETYEDIRNVMHNHFNKNITLIDASKPIKVKPYCVKVVGGYYDGAKIWKMTARHLCFAYNENDIQRFATEKQAQAFIEKLKAKQFTNCKEFAVECIA